MHGAFAESLSNWKPVLADRIGAAHSGVAERVDNLEAPVLGEALDGLELPMLAIPVGTDIGRLVRT